MELLYKILSLLFWVAVFIAFFVIMLIINPVPLILGLCAFVLVFLISGILLFVIIKKSKSKEFKENKDERI